MIRALAPLTVALVLLAAACSNGDSDEDAGTPTADVTVLATITAPAACAPGFAAAPGDSAGTVSSGGADRTYLLHVPTGYDGLTPMPLVVVYHGFDSSAQSIADYTRFSVLADEEGFVVAYPQAAGAPARWNDGGDVTIADDVLFTRALVEKLKAELCVDESRTYAVGYSNGGGMAQRVACELPDVFSALGTVAATYSDCKGPLPWIAFHGMADPQVPFEGGVNPLGQGVGVFFPTRRVLSEYARELGCDPLAQITRPSTEVELSTYGRCREGEGLVLLYTLIGGGHTWPGSTDLPLETFGATNTQIDATQAMWEFFVTLWVGSNGDGGDPSAPG